jgi:FkbM family methyltransferase
VKKFQKDFLGPPGDTEYHFLFAEHDPGESHAQRDLYIRASTDSFSDEETVRQKYFYPYLKKGDVVLDIGAGFGSYTLPALAMGCEVIAFSPERDCEGLLANLELNKGMPSGHLRLISDTGLYDREGYFQTIKNAFSDANTDPGPNTIKVLPYDTWVANNDSAQLTHKKLNYIKIDVEGAELHVLMGARGAISRSRPVMLVENHLFHEGGIAQAVIDFVRSLFGDTYLYQTEKYHAISHTLFRPRPAV